MTQSVENVTPVGASIAPRIGAFAGDFVFLELTFIDGTICPLERASAIEETLSQLSLVLMAVFELTGSLSVVYLANL